MRAQPIAVASAKFDLSVGLVERRSADGAPAGIDGVLEYASDLFERASVEALGARLIRLLEGAVADPDRALGALSILDAAERDTILRLWNDTGHSLAHSLAHDVALLGDATPATLPALFAAQALRTPDATAVIFEDRTLTYAALDAHANRLAHHLQGLGVGPDVLVGVCAERSLELVVGLLGMLKAGGAYLPLDPEYPARTHRRHGDGCGIGRGADAGRARAGAGVAPGCLPHPARPGRAERGAWLYSHR